MKKASGSRVCVVCGGERVTSDKDVHSMGQRQVQRYRVYVQQLGGDGSAVEATRKLFMCVACNRHMSRALRQLYGDMWQLIVAQQGLELERRHRRGQHAAAAVVSPGEQLGVGHPQKRRADMNDFERGVQEALDSIVSRALTLLPRGKRSTASDLAGKAAAIHRLQLELTERGFPEMMQVVRGDVRCAMEDVWCGLEIMSPGITRRVAQWLLNDNVRDENVVPHLLDCAFANSAPVLSAAGASACNLQRPVGGPLNGELLRFLCQAASLEPLESVFVRLAGHEVDAAALASRIATLRCPEREDNTSVCVALWTTSFECPTLVVLHGVTANATVFEAKAALSRLNGLPTGKLWLGDLMSSVQMQDDELLQQSLMHCVLLLHGDAV